MAASRMGRPLRADRPRRAARHRPERAATARASRSTTWTTSSPWSRATSSAPSRPRPSRGARDRARGGRALRATGSRASTWCPRSRRCGGAATRSSSRCCARTQSRWESLSEADRERVEAMARARGEPAAPRAHAAPQGSAARAPRTATCTPPRAVRARRRALSALEDARRRGHAARRRRQRARPVIRLGTRGSALALAQAHWVADACRARSSWSPITTVAATGAATGSPADKSRFVKEIEEALLAGEVDLAVHSAKDVPGRAARRPRDRGRARARRPARRALRRATRSTSSPDGARGRHREPAPPRRSCSRCGPTSTCASCAATSTPGCASWPTGDFDAIVLARAGLDRLGRAAEGAPLEPERAASRPPGQGSLALEARARDDPPRARPPRRSTRPRRARVLCRRARASCAALGRRPATRRSARTRALDGDGLRLTHAFVGPARRLALDPRRARRRPPATRRARAAQSPSACWPRARAELLRARGDGRCRGAMRASGIVYLVGAGPGDPGLMTAPGARADRAAPT